MEDNLKMIVLRVDMMGLREVKEVLKDNDVPYIEPNRGGMVWDSALYDLVIEVASSPYCLPSLSAAIIAFLKRNSGNKVTVNKKGGLVLELRGYSKKQVSEIIKDVNLIEISGNSNDS